MKKYLPLLKPLFFINLMCFCMLTFLVYFGIKTPGLHGLSLEKTIWTTNDLITLYSLTLASTSITIILMSLSATKSISDLGSRFLKSSRFKLIDKSKIIAYLNSEQYSVKDDFYYKVLNEKNMSKIKIILSDNEIEIRHDQFSIANFQMDKKYCEEINKLRTSCVDAIGSELV